MGLSQGAALVQGGDEDFAKRLEGVRRVRTYVDPEVLRLDRHTLLRQVTQAKVDLTGLPHLFDPKWKANDLKTYFQEGRPVVDRSPPRSHLNTPSPPPATVTPAPTEHAPPPQIASPPRPTKDVPAAITVHAPANGVPPPITAQTAPSPMLPLCAGGKGGAFAPAASSRPPNVPRPQSGRPRRESARRSQSDSIIGTHLAAPGVLAHAAQAAYAYGMAHGAHDGRRHSGDGGGDGFGSARVTGDGPVVLDSMVRDALALDASQRSGGTSDGAAAAPGTPGTPPAEGSASHRMRRADSAVDHHRMAMGELGLMSGPRLCGAPARAQPLAPAKMRERITRITSAWRESARTAEAAAMVQEA